MFQQKEWDEKAELIQDTKDWIEEHPIEAVETYCKISKNLELYKLWNSNSFIEYRKLIDWIYDKYSDDIFDYLIEHPEKMR